MSNTKQADGEIHEDQLLRFLVNSIDEEVALTPTKNAELDAEDIYEDPSGACADGTSVSTLCEKSEDAPHENSVLSHFRTEFDLETLEQVGTRSFRKTFSTSFPSRWRSFGPPPAALLRRRRRGRRPVSLTSLKSRTTLRTRLNTQQGSNN